MLPLFRSNRFVTCARCIASLQQLPGRLIMFNVFIQYILHEYYIFKRYRVCFNHAVAAEIQTYTSVYNNNNT